MRRRVALAAILLAASPALAGSVQPTIALTDTGTLMGATSIAVGEPLLVVLPSQAGTGFAWEVGPADPAVLEPQTAQCAGARGGSLVGATVPACFAWAGRARGTTTLSFTYRRHWEIQPDNVLRYDLAVTVTSGM